MVNAQEWLDKRYPRKRKGFSFFWKDRKKIAELDISGPDWNKKNDDKWDKLEGDLDLSDFTNLESLKCSFNQLTSINLSNCQQLKEVNCSHNQLVSLDLTNVRELKALNCAYNQLDKLILPTRLLNLKLLYCADNLLTNLDFDAIDSRKLVVLALTSNNFSKQDLSCFSKFTNLEELYLGNVEYRKINQGVYNRFIGSLQHLKNMQELHSLSIDNTDIIDGVEYLPSSVVELRCSWIEKPDSKVKLVAKALEKKSSDFILEDRFNQMYLRKELNWKLRGQLVANYFYRWSVIPTQETLLTTLMPGQEWRDYYKKNGLCDKCEQLNGEERWCQPCNVSHLQEDFSNWTSGNPEIDAFIQKSQLEATNKQEVLEWIPYEQLTEIEYLAEGGFSKVYRAKWTEGQIFSWNTNDNKWRRWSNLSNQEKLKRAMRSFERDAYWQNFLENLENSTNLFDRAKRKYFEDFESWNEDKKRKILEDMEKHRYVALKVLHNSQNITTEFLQEINIQRLVDNRFVVSCYGISQDPETKNYIMVMKYMSDGNLRQYLSKNHSKLSFPNRLAQLMGIMQSLCSIHQANLVHQDLHSGNVLNWLLYDNHVSSEISDLGLSRPVNEESSKSKIYGVLPYVAPEVLRGSKYTPETDIYSFGIIAYELLTQTYPYANLKLDNVDLALSVCKGLRPKIEELPIPRLLKDLIKSCWHVDPKKRPTAGEIWSVLRDWTSKTISIRKGTDFYQQYQAIEKEYNTFSLNTPYQIHSNKITISQLINTKEIARLFQESEEQALEQELKKLEKEINQPLTDEQKELVSEFIQVKKWVAEGKKEEGEVWELEDKLKENGLLQENIDKITLYCDRLVEQLERLQLQANVETPTSK